MDRCGKTEVASNQFSIASVFLLFAGVAVILAAGVALHASPSLLMVIATMFVARTILIFHARWITIAIPLLLLTIAMPIVAAWPDVEYVWSRNKTPIPVMSWFLLAFVILIPPTSLWLFDYFNRWDSKKLQLFRLGFEIPLISVWIFLYISMLVGIADTN